jgi:hypothetical protein
MVVNIRPMDLSPCALVGAISFGCAVLCADEPTTRPIVSEAMFGKLGKPVVLFDGRDLDGWIWFQRPPKPGTTQPTTRASVNDVWTVRDGVLHGMGKPTGYIRTDASFENYVLRVEQRHIGKGNGGILFGISGEDKVWPHCLEVQGATGEEGDIRNVADFKMTMDAARLESRRLKRLGPDPEKPPGEWETIQLVVNHGNITVHVNGKLQNVARVDEPFTGRIGLQAEGGEMEYRQVLLMPIEERD